MPIPRPYLKALAIVWTVLILIGTLMPRNDLLENVGEGGGLHRIPGLDKVVHFTMFAGFVVTWWLAIESPRARLFVIVAAAVSLGALTEVFQMIPALGRDAGLDDLAADAAGAAVAAMGLIWLARRVRAPASA